MKLLKIIFYSVVVVFGLFVFSALINPSGPSSADVEACVKRGEAYFKEVGSYPTLSDGRNATEVARTRCEKTLTAF